MNHPTLVDRICREALETNRSNNTAESAWTTITLMIEIALMRWH